ncbi:target of Nesh-SH3 isoform X2 [Mugil cephalus]|uniref:target of Nesh-SH3 isoform X2 n=1 Tax=Mugil cephalus TaxID=48193 RepID=UPI001FB7837F|nr:target of Nesh-SH3 isoform X2 [Mugil cephalus]
MMSRMQRQSHVFLVLLLVVFIAGIVLSGPPTPRRRSRVRRQNMKVRINATGDTIVMKFLRPNADTKLEGYILGYGSSMFSKQFIQLPENGQPYETEFDAEPKYLIAVQPIPINEVKKQCTGKVQLEKPLHLVIGSVTPTSVLLSWGTLLKTPYEGNIMNDCLEDGHYTVRYREKNRKWNYQTCPTSDTVIDNLKPNTVYEFGVQPNSKDRPGVWSKPVIHNVSMPERPIRKNFKHPINPVKPSTSDTHPFLFPSHHVPANRTRGRQPPPRNIAPKTTLAPTTTTRQESLSTPGPTLPLVAKQPIGRGGLSRSVFPPSLEVPLATKLHHSQHTTSTMTSVPPQRKTQSLPHTQPYYQPSLPTSKPQQPQPLILHAQNEPQPQSTSQPIPQTQPQLHTTSRTEVQPRTRPQKTTQPEHHTEPQPQVIAISQSKHHTQPPTQLKTQTQPPPLVQPTSTKTTPVTLSPTTPQIHKQTKSPQPQLSTKQLSRTKPTTGIIFAQPKPTTQPQHKNEPKPTTQSQHKNEPDPTAQPLHKNQPKSTTRPQHKNQPKPTTQPQPKRTTQPQHENQPKPPTQPQRKNQPKPTTQPQLKNQPKPTIQPQHKNQRKPATQHQHENQPKPPTQPQHENQPKPATQPQHENQPKPLVPPQPKKQRKPQPKKQTQSQTQINKPSKPQQRLPNIQPQPQSPPPRKTQIQHVPISQPKPGPQFQPQTRTDSDPTKVSPRRADPTAPSPPEEGKPLPRPALATEEAGSYNHGTGVNRHSVAEVPRFPISSSVPTAGRNTTLHRIRVAPHPTNHGVRFSPSNTVTSSHSSNTPGASGAHHRGIALPKPVVWSRGKPVLRPAVPGNKRPNQVGKPNNDKPMTMKGDKEFILKPFPLVTVKPKLERRPQTTTLPPAVNITRFDKDENYSIFRPLPASEVDIMGKKRFVAPHVIYKTDKKPDEPCSITSSLAYFPDEEGSDQSVTAPPRVPPSNLTVVTVEGCPSFVILDWQNADNETREYEVVSTTKGPNGREVSILTTNQTHTAVENLKPESSYEFTVTPKNELGTGPTSDPVSFSTESADPRVSEHVSGKDAIWTQFPFKSDGYSECNGKQYVKRTWYRKFVGIQLCNSLRYKIYLSDSLNGKFYNIGDQTGYGEDHCQFVDSFLDGRTGTQMLADQLPARRGFYRAMRQEPVSFGEIGGKSHVTYVGWYECGTPIPGKW